jgi:hypothetical protein
MTVLHSIGEAFRVAMLQVPLSAVRILFIATFCAAPHDGLADAEAPTTYCRFSAGSGSQSIFACLCVFCALTAASAL